MKIIFAGTPAFAEAALVALVEAGHDVVLALTREDQPAGRGQQLRPSPVKQRALTHGIPVLQPRTLRDDAIVQALTDVQADVMVVAAYGRILPATVLAIPKHGCLNIHASLLPRWRGAAPIQRAIEAGDVSTGITIMQMDEGLDTGDMLRVDALAIGPEESASSVHDRLMALGARAIVEALRSLERGELKPVRQPESGVTYARKLEKAEAALDWSKDAQTLHDKVRAFDAFPGATAVLARTGDTLKIWRTQVLADIEGSADGGRPSAAPGAIAIDERGDVAVQTGQGRLRLLELQKPGGRRLPVGEFVKGYPLVAGDRFTVLAEKG